ncbi:MAG: hypothetical protein RL392_2034 [Pseudomonadota bacterium]
MSKSVTDIALATVANRILELDPSGDRIGGVLRSTLDQLYDGQRTGRYRLEQLHKTEKTHCGTLVEINLHKEFKFADGIDLDYQIAGNEVDCKYSQKIGGWMIPPEAHGKLCLLVWASDELSKWNIGIVRAHANLLGGKNRDGKATLNEDGRLAIHWIYSPHQNGTNAQLSQLRHLELQPNILLQLPEATVKGIMTLKHGTKRLNELFRVAVGQRVGRGVVATVAQQDDFMKRIRENGGSRGALRPEGIIILGQYKSHVAIAKALAVPTPGPGESVSVRVSPAVKGEPDSVLIENQYWKKAVVGDPVVSAPKLTFK